MFELSQFDYIIAILGLLPLLFWSIVIVIDNERNSGLRLLAILAVLGYALSLTNFILALFR